MQDFRAHLLRLASKHPTAREDLLALVASLPEEKPVVKQAASDSELWEVTSVSMYTEEDDWAHGQVGSRNFVLSEKHVGSWTSPQQVKNALVSKFGFPDDKEAWFAMDEEDGRLCLSFTVDEDNNIPSAQQLARWKKGEEKMWTADVDVYLRLATVRSPDAKEIAEAFGVKVE